jgi:hypothetical protein
MSNSTFCCNVTVELRHFFLSGSREMNSVIPSSLDPYPVKRALHNPMLPSGFRGERRNPPSVTMGISGFRSPIRCKERLAVMPNA